jgi:hypothetical protein
MWKIENGGYFVYPGSPISITKREMGVKSWIISFYLTNKNGYHYINYFEKI